MSERIKFLITALSLAILLVPSLAAAQGAEVSSAQARGAQYIFIIDDSGSMSMQTSSGPPADPERLSVFAARSLMSMLDDADEATVIRLNGPDDAEPILPVGALSTQRAELERALALDSKLAAYAGKNTPCSTALQAAQQELNRVRRPHVAQVVIFLTDGECTGAAPDPSSFLRGVESHADGLFKFYLLRFKGRDYTRSLVTLATQTGGEAAEISASDPTAILQPFANALSRSQGYEATLLMPGRAQIDAHLGARRVRLLAVAPDRGQVLGLSLVPTRRSSVEAAPMGAVREGVHQYKGGKRFRYAALDYKPGDAPVEVRVSGAGNDWKVVAVPEYRLFIDLLVRQGDCGANGEQVQFVEVGGRVCVQARLVNDAGQPVTLDVAGRGTEASIRYTGPGQPPATLPANRLGDAAVFSIERANLERGDHVFVPMIKMVTPGTQTAITLRGAARSLQVSSHSVEAVPSQLALGQLVPGDEQYLQLVLKGNFPESQGRMIVEGRANVPDCVTFELSGAAEGKDVALVPEQQYTLTVRVAPYCGAASFSKDVTTALRLEFDKAASSRTPPAVVIPTRFTLSSKLELPEVLRVRLTGGSRQDVEGTIRGNFKRPLTFKLLMPPAGERGASWPADRLQLAFLDAKRELVMGKGKRGTLASAHTLTVAAGQPGALSLAALADACCQAGSWRTEVTLIATHGSKEAIRIPVEIDVEEAGVWGCWGRTILMSAGFLLLLLIGLYIFNMFHNSSFIDRNLLASKLVPLRWDEWGEPQPQANQLEEVKRMVRRAMPPHQRALSWLRCNPLKFGLPGGHYEESVQLYLEPARDVHRSSIQLVADPDLFTASRANPNQHVGRIYATAKGGLYIFCFPDRNGRLGRLEFPEPMDGGWDSYGDEEFKAQQVRLKRHELLDVNADREADTAAGWRVG
jgi:Mg-chelatase subunit ChlD